MTTVAVLVLCFIVGVFAMQSVLAFGFLGGLSIQWRSSAEYSPKVAIVLCLRGADPFLDRCIRALAQLNYPNFEVRIVVDDKQDPSWEILQRELTEQGAFRLAVDQLRSPNITCSLKCSSVAQAIRELDDSIEVVALLDADTIVHPNWLRELITPLADPTVGATTGNRWYMPERLSLGSLVRYSWNAAAVVIMYWCRIAWGGTLAIRRSVIDRADLLTRWQNAFCEDTMLFDTLRAHGLRQVFVPSLMMVNRENCTLRGVSAWITRQLLNSRLYHPGWLLTVMHCFATVLAPLLAFISLIAAMALQDGEAALWSACGLAAYQIGLILLLVPIEARIRQIVARRGERSRWLTPSIATMLPVAIVVTQIVYPWTLLRAIFIRNVEWRGVHYKVRGPWDIRLEEYVPFDEAISVNERYSL